MALAMGWVNHGRANSSQIDHRSADPWVGELKARGTFSRSLGMSWWVGGEGQGRVLSSELLVLS